MHLQTFTSISIHTRTQNRTKFIYFECLLTFNIFSLSRVHEEFNTVSLPFLFKLHVFLSRFVVSSKMTKLVFVTFFLHFAYSIEKKRIRKNTSRVYSQYDDLLPKLQFSTSTTFSIISKF